ncbi:MAG TPA: LamG-like jellyroll fold domain-containing protein, partial [Armatimonadota bacterium]|nr:LamG-like jellyroll fold domain-containing protein [Armatimonadota bacterium]
MKPAIATLTLCLLASAAPAQDTPRLLLHMPFDSDLTLAAGQGPAEFIGGEPVFVEGRHGMALDLTKGQRIVLPTPGNLDKSHGSVCIWVRPHWPGDLYQNHIFLQEDLPFNSGENSMRLWHWCVGVLRFDVRDESDRYIQTPCKDWQPEQWHHLAATWDGSSGVRLYLDGALAVARGYEYQPRPSESFLIGGSRTGDDALAALDDLRVYDWPLAPDQVRRVMSGLPLERIEYLSLDAPQQVRLGEPFDATVRFRAPEGMTGDYRVSASIGDLPLGEAAVQAPAAAGTPVSGRLSALAPLQFYAPPGAATLSVRVSGTIPV